MWIFFSLIEEEEEEENHSRYQMLRMTDLCDTQSSMHSWISFCVPLFFEPAGYNFGPERGH